MFIVFIPFPTGLISEYPEARVSLVFYAISLAMAGFMICLVLWYGIHDHRLVDEDVDRSSYRRFMFGYISMAVVFLLSIPVSYLNVHAARFFWLLIIPINFLFDHGLMPKLDARKTASKGKAP
jgi:uncharacterized membrane protein